MKAYKWLAVSVALQSAIVIAYLLIFQIFPENRSADFLQHLRISESLTKGDIPDLNQQFLYYGVEWFLALSQVVFSSVEPLVTIQWAMGLMVCVSPVVVYVAAKEIFASSKLALVASFFWVFCGGYIWFGAVFGSGLYANYLGFIASLLLVSATMYFERKGISVKSALCLSLALVIALFSHYSVLIVFPSLLSLLLWMSIKSRPRKLLNPHSTPLLILLAPLTAGLILFHNPTQILQRIVTADSLGSGVPQLTWLGSLIPMPSIQYALAEIAPPAPFRWDLPAVGLFILLLSFLYQARKEKNPKLWILFGWFVTALSIAPFNSLAWRFSFVALVPLTLMAPFGLYWLKNWLYIDRFNVHRKPMVRFYSPKALGCLSLITFLIFPGVFAGSWTTGLVYDVTANNPQAASGMATYQAIQWMKAHDQCDVKNLVGEFEFQGRSCAYVTPTDWRLTYSQDFGGPQTNLVHPFLATPETVTAGAGNFSANYVVVSKVDTVTLNYCVNPGGQLIDLKVLNSTRGNSLKLGVSMQPRLNASNGPMGFYLDGQPFGRFILQKGEADITILQMPRGEHDLRVRSQFAGSNVITVFMGQDSAPRDHGAVGNYCDPWFWQVDDWGGSARIVYQNAYVKIWCITEGCAP